MSFQRRTEPPKEPNTNYFSYRNIYYRDRYEMPNCTCYALGRFHEICNVWLPVKHNAEEWGTDVAPKGIKVQKYPLLGAVAIWKVGKIGNGKDGAGHVAIVEAIRANGDIVCSNSGWYRCEVGVLPENDKRYQQLFWYEQTFKASKGYAWTGSKGKKYELVGFILPTKFQKERADKKTCLKNCTMHISENSNTLCLTNISRNDKLKYEGIYKIGADGKKWLHGTLLKAEKNKPALMGWVSAECFS